MPPEAFGEHFPGMCEAAKSLAGVEVPSEPGSARPAVHSDMGVKPTKVETQVVHGTANAVGFGVLAAPAPAAAEAGASASTCAGSGRCTASRASLPTQDLEVEQLHPPGHLPGQVRVDRGPPR